VAESDPRIEEAFSILKKSASNMNSQHDECTTYGLYVGNKIRNYTPKTRALIQHYINNLLFDADMGKYDFVDPTSQWTNSMLPTVNLQTHSSPTNLSTSLHPLSSASSLIDPSDGCSNEGDMSSMSNYYTTFSDTN